LRFVSGEIIFFRNIPTIAIGSISKEFHLKVPATKCNNYKHTPKLLPKRMAVAEAFWETNHSLISMILASEMQEKFKIRSLAARTPYLQNTLFQECDFKVWIDNYRSEKNRMWTKTNYVVGLCVYTTWLVTLCQSKVNINWIIFHT
jgi:hypothetical protein